MGSHRVGHDWSDLAAAAAGTMLCYLSMLSHVWLFETPWTVAHQAPLSMWFPRQEYWNELPFPPPGDFQDPGIKPWSHALQADSLLLSHQVSLWLRTIVDKKTWELDDFLIFIKTIASELNPDLLFEIPGQEDPLEKEITTNCWNQLLQIQEIAKGLHMI